MIDGHDHVEVALDEPVDPLEHRRLELEQRQRLAGHELHPVHEDLHRRGRDAHLDARPVAAVHEVDRLLLRERRVGDEYLVDLVEVLLEVLERAEVLEAVLGARRERDEADRVDLPVLAAGQRVRDRLDLRARPNQDRAAAVTRGAQEHARDAVERPAERRDVEQREQQAPVEDVVRGEGLALDDRVGEDHDRDLEERRDDAREARAAGAVGVEVRAREQQDRDETGERRVLVGLVDEEPDVVVAAGADDRLQLERGPDGGEHARGVADREDQHAEDAAERLPADQPAAEEALGRADVTRGEIDRRALRRLDLSELVYESVGHRFTCTATRIGS